MYEIPKTHIYFIDKFLQYDIIKLQLIINRRSNFEWSGGAENEKMAYFLLIVSVALGILLCGCRASDQADTVASLDATVGPTAAPTAAVTEAAETEAAEPSLPWELPEKSPDPSYTDYFAEERTYDFKKDLYIGNGMNLIADSSDPRYWTGVYTLEQDEESLRVVPYKTSQETWVVGPAENYRDCVWAVATPDRAYGFRAGREVVSVDYLSGEITTLYRDETGALSELVEGENHISTGRMILADSRVLYFLAGCEDAAGIYRLYLPEGQVDFVYGGIPLDTKPFLETPLFTSNWKVGWCERNPEYAALKEELNTPDSPYLAEYYAKLPPGREPDRVTIHEILYEAIRLNYGLEPFQLYQYDVETGALSNPEPET